jgi:aminoglycoside phosphotransferase (APT) family kinase protein
MTLAHPARPRIAELVARTREFVDTEVIPCVYRNPALDVVLGIPAAWTSPQLPAPDELAQDYTRASGRDLGDWPFYLGLAHLKLAVIAEGIAYRAREGADAGRDAHRAAEVVPELVAAGAAALGPR